MSETLFKSRCAIAATASAAAEEHPQIDTDYDNNTFWEYKITWVILKTMMMIMIMMMTASTMMTTKTTASNSSERFYLNTVTEIIAS